MKSSRAIIQVGIVVADARKAAKEYARLLGLRDWHINQVDTSEGIGLNFRSADGDIPVRATIAWAEIGGIEIELIEPNDDTSPYAVFLRESGPGVHHLMFSTGDHDADVRSLEASRVPVILAGELQETTFRLFDTRERLGTIMELAEGGSLRPDESFVVED
jgi:catechol 2,3-dioxygenase-like lactoylglutathione lyase family enzyme